jgi:hypothetical protein
VVIGGVAALDQRIGLRYTMSHVRESENGSYLRHRRLPEINPSGMYWRVAATTAEQSDDDGGFLVSVTMRPRSCIRPAD